MKILVNKCPDTGELFESDSQYKTHRARVNREKRAEAAKVRMHEEFYSWLRNEKEKITAVEMITPWFLANEKIIMNACTNGIRSRFSSWDNKFVPEDTFSRLEINGLKYDRNLSNSHVCPDKGVSNWCARDGKLPTGYPGWRGQVEGTLSRPIKMRGSYPTSDALNLVGIKTGTGGGGNERWGYDCSIFLDDWPGLKEVVRIMEEDAIVKKLMGRRFP